MTVSEFIGEEDTDSAGAAAGLGDHGAGALAGVHVALEQLALLGQDEGPGHESEV